MMVNSRLIKLVFSLLSLGLVMPAQAANWNLLGESSFGKHYIDMGTLEWEVSKTAFTINTRVVQPDSAEWLTTIRVDCKDSSYAYLSGSKTQDGQELSEFETPKPASAIVRDSMPDQLKGSFCGVRSIAGQWESIGKSKISEVFFNRKSIKQYADGSHFLVDTRVVPFDKSQETLSTLSFDCDASTFIMTRMSTLKDGKLTQVFDKPKPTTMVSKTATLETLSQKFCVEIPIVNDWQELDVGGKSRLYLSNQSVRWSTDRSFFSIMLKSTYDQGSEMINHVSIDCDKNTSTFLGGTLKVDDVIENLGAEPPKTILANTPFGTIKRLYCGQ
jgi:hypothetical protein